MKRKFFSIFFSLFLVANGFSQSSLPVIDSPEYEAMKMAGTLPKGVIFHGAQNVSNPIVPGPSIIQFDKSGAHNILQGPNRSPNPVSWCSCLVPIDNTFSVVPFTNGTPPDYRNDDGSTNVINIPFNFCLYGTNYNQLYINNNGNISFGASWFTFTSAAFPSASYVMVAPVCRQDKLD